MTCQRSIQVLPKPGLKALLENLVPLFPSECSSFIQQTDTNDCLSQTNQRQDIFSAGWALITMVACELMEVLRLRHMRHFSLAFKLQHQDSGRQENTYNDLKEEYEIQEINSVVKA